MFPWKIEHIRETASVININVFFFFFFFNREIDRQADIRDGDIEGENERSQIVIII